MSFAILKFQLDNSLPGRNLEEGEGKRKWLG